MRLWHLCFLGLFASAANASEYPTVGLVYNLKEDSSITYNCKLSNANNRLYCDFIQTSVRKKAKVDELERKLADARVHYQQSLQRASEPKDCAVFSVMYLVLTGKMNVNDGVKRAPEWGGDPAEFRKGIEKARLEAKADPSLIETMRLVASACQTPSEEAFLALARADHARSVKTCLVSSGQFSQEFVWVSDYGKSGAWVVAMQPTGPCGVVNLSRFEMDRATTKNVLFWNYVARKAVTNPSGEIVPGLACSSLDQAEYPYTWKQSRSDRLQCEYVVFSPF